MLQMVRTRTGFERRVVDEFHRIYYDAKDSWFANTYMGYRISQHPNDMYNYQELVHRTRPSFVVQTGVFLGGSILYFAHLLDLLKAPPSTVVVGVDIELKPEAKTLDHPRIRLLEASSVEESTLEKIASLLPPNTTGLVSLDSDHSRDHVLKEMRLYQRFVGVGGNMVVEDTNVHGHPVLKSHGPGPHEAVEAFLAETNDFVRDDSLWKRQLFSFHQYGWLKRVK